MVFELTLKVNLNLVTVNKYDQLVVGEVLSSYNGSAIIPAANELEEQWHLVVHPVKTNDIHSPSFS